VALTPISPAGWAQPVDPEGFTPRSPADVRLFFNRVSPDYFTTMRTPVLMGREFNEHDDANSLKVIVINQEAARTFFGSANPLGKTMGLAKPGRRGERELYSVIGVVKDTRYNRIDEPVKRIGYLAAAQDERPGADFQYVVRTRGGVEEIIPSIRAAVSAANRDASLEFRNFETQVKESILQPQVVALLSSVFGLLALLLATIGLYGITTFAVERRRAEIGIRMALGAQRGLVVRMMLRDIAVLAAAGISLGAAGALAAGQLVTKLLYGVRPNDPWQLAGAGILLASAIAIAAYVPARRAARLDPMTALREE
jgi:predicted permease